MRTCYAARDGHFDRALKQLLGDDISCLITTATGASHAGYGLGRLATGGRKIAGRAGQIGRGGLGMAFALVGAAILTGFDQRLEAAFIDAMPDWLVTFATRL